MPMQKGGKENSSEPVGPQQGDQYRIKVKGIFGKSWVHVLQLNAETILHHDCGAPTTTLLIRVIDQAELLGVLARLHGLNFSLLAVEHCPSDDP